MRSFLNEEGSLPHKLFGTTDGSVAGKKGMVWKPYVLGTRENYGRPKRSGTEGRFGS